ncbi:hypothetical protein JOB18_003219, partial [Solea senegalensis]
DDAGALCGHLHAPATRRAVLHTQRSALHPHHSCHQRSARCDFSLHLLCVCEPQLLHPER